jgi:opacity protein-like surface antigen
MKSALFSFLFPCVLFIAQSSEAVSRRVTDSPFMHRTAVGGLVGVGVPIGDFGDQAYGNHKSGGLDWSVEFEHYFGPFFSLGLNFTAGVYEDEEFGGDLKTKLNTFGGYLRYVIVTPSDLYPFLKFGVGSMEVEFDSPEENVDSEHSASIVLGAGVIWMVTDNISINGQTAFTRGWTEDAYIRAADAIVGFDVSHWTFDAGLSIYFP